MELCARQYVRFVQSGDCRISDNNGVHGAGGPGKWSHHAESGYPVTITATLVADSSQSASATINAAQQYAIVLYPGNGSLGMVASVTLDGNGNVIGGEADGSPTGFTGMRPPLPGPTFWMRRATAIFHLASMARAAAATLQQTHGITATSNSHLVIAEEDNFNGLTIGAVGSMDLQTALQPGPSFSGSQVSGGYSFTLAGYSGAAGENTSWGGIFTADGTATTGAQGNITGEFSTQLSAITGAAP